MELEHLFDAGGNEEGVEFARGRHELYDAGGGHHAAVEGIGHHGGYPVHERVPGLAPLRSVRIARNYKGRRVTATESCNHGFLPFVLAVLGLDNIDSDNNYLHCCYELLIDNIFKLII